MRNHDYSMRPYSTTVVMGWAVSIVLGCRYRSTVHGGDYKCMSKVFYKGIKFTFLSAILRYRSRDARGFQHLVVFSSDICVVPILSWFLKHFNIFCHNNCSLQAAKHHRSYFYIHMYKIVLTKSQSLSGPPWQKSCVCWYVCLLTCWIFTIQWSNEAIAKRTFIMFLARSVVSESRYARADIKSMSGWLDVMSFCTKHLITRNITIKTVRKI